MKIISAMLLPLIALPSLASTLIECDLNVSVKENFGIIKTGTEYLHINVPLTVFVEKIISKDAQCAPLAAQSMAIELAIPYTVYHKTLV